MRRTGLVLLSVLITTLGILVPLSAFAADPPIVVNWAASASGDLGALQVSVTSAEEITGLKAHVISPTTGEEVASTEDFALTSGTAENGVWTTKETFKLDQPASYPVNVEATAADGTHVTADSAGYLYYFRQVLFDPLTANRSTVSYAHRDVTVRGRIQSRAPDTREITPFTGAPVDFSIDVTNAHGNGSSELVELRSDAKGRFSCSRTLKDQADFQAGFRSQSDFPGYLDGGSGTLEIAVKQSPARVTETIAPRRLNAGGQITVSGQATWKSPTGWQPLAGASLYVNGVYPPDVVTDADGRYATTLVPSVSRDIPVAYGSGDPFIGNASATAKVIVVQPSVIGDFDAVPGPSMTVEVSGTLAFPGAGAPYEPDLDIEFSPDGAKWTRKATLKDAGGFSATVPAPRPGYWRAHYRGAPEFQPSISRAIYADPR